MKLEFLILHYLETSGHHWFDADDVTRWHTQPPPYGNGWKKAGYTDLILLDGTIQNITPFDQDDEVDGFEITNGVRGKNSISRHIAYVGGLNAFKEPADTRTPQQVDTMKAYIKVQIARNPGIKVAGHNQFSDKACPGFDVPEWLESIGVCEDNIYRP